MAMDVVGRKGGVVGNQRDPARRHHVVLLIIMMLIAPLLQKGVNVRLPIADNTVEKPDTQEQTVVHVDATRRVLRQQRPGRAGELRDRIDDALEEKKEKIVFLKADADAPYGAVMDMMDKLREARHRERRPDHRHAKKAGRAGGGN